MQEHAVADEPVAISSERGVASNYALILVGTFIFPIILFGLFAAKKRRVTAKEWEMSHYEFQYRTAVGFTLGILAGLLVAIAVLSSIPTAQAYKLTR